MTKLSLHTIVSDGKECFLVCTDSISEGKGFPYETMVFRCDKDGNVSDFDELDAGKAETLDGAIKMHEYTVEWWSNDAETKDDLSLRK